MSTCTITPKIGNKEGKSVDSILFKDILKFTNNREYTKKLYSITRSNDFQSKITPTLLVDDNSEPTLPSLMYSTNLFDKVSPNLITSQLKKDVGVIKEGKPIRYLKNEENYRALFNKVVKFNTTNPHSLNYKATVSEIPDSESNRSFYTISFTKREKLKSIGKVKEEFSKSLNTKLREILTNAGVSIGALTEYERRAGIDGVTDFQQSVNLFNGMHELIRLAEGNRGEVALPEEFAHFVLEAMSENPIIERMVSTIIDNNLIESIIGEDYNVYKESYGDNYRLLAKEAMGKLLAKYLINQEAITNQDLKPYSNFINRVITAVKTFIKNTFKKSDLDNVRNDLESQFNNLAKDVLHGIYNKDISVKNTKSKELLYSTKAVISKDRALLEKAIIIEAKRLHIYNTRSSDALKSIHINNLNTLNNMEASIGAKEYIKGLYDFTTSVSVDLNKVMQRLIDLKATPKSDAQQIKIIKEIDNCIQGYESIISDIRQFVKNNELDLTDSNKEYLDKMKPILGNLKLVLDDIQSDIMDMATPLFLNWFKTYYGESRVDNATGKVITAEEVLSSATKDVVGVRRLLLPMASSNDAVIRIYDLAVRNSKLKARQETIDLAKQIELATYKLEQAGVKDTSWIYERLSSGTHSGKLISKINVSEFEINLKKIRKELIDRYGDNPKGDDLIKYNTEFNNWKFENTEVIDNKRGPKLSRYGNKDFEGLNEAQKEYYNTYIEIKNKLDSYIPPDAVKKLDAVQIRKDSLERLLSSNSSGEFFRGIKEQVKGTLVNRVDDIGVSSKITSLDFAGKEINTVPIYYTKRLEHSNEISTDASSALIAYASMAIEYRELNELAPMLEAGIDIVSKREITQTQGNHSLKERIKFGGRNDVKIVTISGESTKFMKQLHDFMNMQVYGKRQKEEGTLLNSNISVGKAANLLNRTKSIVVMGSNYLGGLANVAQGATGINVEAISGEFFNLMEATIADSEYAKNLPGLIANLGSRVKDDKLSLWSELVDPTQDYEQTLRNKQLDRKSFLSKIFNGNFVYFQQSMGEHYLHHKVSIALATRYKLLDTTGKEVSLWDSLVPVLIDPQNPKFGKKLQIIDGYTKLDGSEFDSNDFIKFTNKALAVNQDIHGVYNEMDMAASQQYSSARLVWLFRKWLPKAYERRFGGEVYSELLEQNKEGYYMTTGKYLLELAKDIRHSRVNLAASWSTLTVHQKANIKRAISELAIWAILMSITNIAFSGDDDDEDRSWASYTSEFLIRRLSLEIGALLPVVNLKDGAQILSSPISSMDVLRNTADLLQLTVPSNWVETIDSGYYKGDTKAGMIFKRSPLSLFYKNIVKLGNPEEALTFYKSRLI